MHLRASLIVILCALPSACASPQVVEEADPGLSYEAIERLSQECRKGDADACVELHVSCVERRRYRSCTELTHADAQALASTPNAFDDPLQYTSYMCIEFRTRSYCEDATPHADWDEAAVEWTEEQILAKTTTPKEKPKKAPKRRAKDSELSKLASHPAFASEPSLAAGFGGSALRAFVVDGTLEELCEKADAMACSTFAMRKGRELRGTYCGIDCGHLYDPPRNASARADALFEEQCTKGDATSCMRMSAWRDNGYPNRRVTAEEFAEDVADEIRGYRKACALGVLAGCNAVVSHVRAYRHAFRSSMEVRPFDDELAQASERACVLANDPSSKECAAHAARVVFEAGPSASQQTKAKAHLEEMGLGARYKQLAYWEVGTP